MFLGTQSVASVVNTTLDHNTAVHQGGALACMDCAILRVIASVKHNRAQEVWLSESAANVLGAHLDQ